jgi:protein-disulfide isomerase
MGFAAVRASMAGLGLSLLMVAAPLGARAAEFTAAQKTAIEAIVKDYLIQNPEVLRDAMVELDRRQKEKEQQAQSSITSDPSSKLYTSPNQAVIGNARGTATLVEFFDYNCGYCKRALGDLAHLMQSDPNLKVILKDYPILTPGSIEAAQVASALRRQFQGDKFWQFHQALLGTRGPVGREQALDVARSMGADMDKLEKDMKDPAIQAGIDETMSVATALNLNGTPSYVVGQDVVVGAVGYDELKAKLDNAHKCGKATC